MELEGDVPPGWLRYAMPVGLALVLLPLLISAVSTLSHGAPTPIRDQALMELRVRDVGVHAVNLGLYSRDGWSHVGPLVFYTLVGPYRLFGSSTSGMVVGALLVNAAAIVGMVVITRRLAGPRAAFVMLLFVSVLVRSMGANLVANPWVLFVSILPFGAFACVVWALMLGRVWALPVGAALATWLVQTHVGYAPLTLPLLVVGAAVMAVAAWRAPIDTGRRGRRARRATVGRALAITVGVLVVLWALPVWDQFRGTGNFTHVARWFSDAKAGVHTIGEGARVVAGQFALVPDWVTGTRRISTLNGETLLRTRLLWPVLLVPFTGALVMAWRRRARPALMLGLVVVGAAGLGVVSVARTVGTMYEYRMLWTWVVGGLAGVVIVWVAWNVVAHRVKRVDAYVVPAVMLSLAILCGVEIVQVGSAARADWDSRPVDVVLGQLSRRLDLHGGQIVLQSESPGGEWDLQGVLLGLSKRGYAARVRADGGGLYPRHLVVDAGRIQTRLLVLAGADLAKMTASDRARVIAYAGPRSLSHELEALRDRAIAMRKLQAAAAAGRITTAEFVRRSQRLPATLDRAVAVVREVLAGGA